jgi:hypothetical protein
MGNDIWGGHFDDSYSIPAQLSLDISGLEQIVATANNSSHYGIHGPFAFVPDPPPCPISAAQFAGNDGHTANHIRHY